MTMFELLSSSGMFAIYGVIIGSVLSGGVAIFRESLNRQRRAKYLAVLVVIALDRYVSNCASALLNTPLDIDHDRDPDDQFNMPDRLLLPTEPDWSSIPAGLAHSILELPQRDAQAHEAVRTIWYLADGYQARSTRDDEFSQIGLEAHSMAKKLRHRFELGARRIGEWDPAYKLSEFRKEYLAQQEEAAAAIDLGEPA